MIMYLKWYNVIILGKLIIYLQAIKEIFGRN